MSLRPADVEARFNLGIALERLGLPGEAGIQFSEALRIKPEFTEARQALEDLIGQKEQAGK